MNDPISETRPKVAIVTGAAKRVGRAIALGLARQGVDLVLHYHSSQEEAQAVAEEIRATGRQVTLVSADLAEPISAAQQIVSASQALGGADLLVNSAAIFEDAPLIDTSEDLFDRHQTINLKAPFFLCQEFARQLPPERAGQIINMVDWRAERPPADFAAYTISKAGLLALSRSLAQQLAPRIRVNAIAPGAILPPPGGNHDRWEAEKVPAIPLGKTGGPDDIVDALLYLVFSPFVTGEVLHVTGGEEL